MTSPSEERPKQGPYHCDVCGRFCRKVASSTYEFYWKCDECGVQYPVGPHPKEGARESGHDGETFRGEIELSKYRGIHREQP